MIPQRIGVVPDTRAKYLDKSLFAPVSECRAAVQAAFEALERVRRFGTESSFDAAALALAEGWSKLSEIRDISRATGQQATLAQAVYDHESRFLYEYTRSFERLVDLNHPFEPEPDEVPEADDSGTSLVNV